jgi:hypothetical protein
MDFNQILGIKIADLTPAELAQFKSALAAVTTEVDTRAADIKKTQETEVFKEAADVLAGLMTNKLAWTKLPKLQAVPTEDGKGYTVSYLAEKKPAAAKKDGEAGKRASPTPESGDITINKIGIAKGKIAFFKTPTADAAGKTQFETIKGAIGALKQPADSKNPGAQEADRCWDISKKGISASDILTRYHKDVILIYENGTEQTVGDAVKEMEEARKAVAASTPAPAAPAPAAPPAA